MNVFVRVLNGPDAGRTIPLRAGQVARFGRTEWADFGFPSDATLGDVHFELRCGQSGSVVLRGLDASGTLLDGVEIAESPVRPGQKITAGQTTFSINFEPGTGAPSLIGGEGAKISGTARPAPLDQDETATVESVCSRFELEADAQRLARSDVSPTEFVTALVASGQLRDALRFQAFRLPKRHAVWWAWRCISDRLPEQNPAAAAALDAAHQWLVEPSEDAARKAGDAAESLGYGPAAAWVAAAAFWSGENIAPPVNPAVAPPEHLTGTAVSAAVLLGSIDGDPKRTMARQRAFLDFADKIICGDDSPPAAGDAARS